MLVQIRYLCVTHKKSFMQEIENILRQVLHPETGDNIVDGGIVERTSSEEGRITVWLKFKRNRDPLSVSIKKQVENVLREAYPGTTVSVFITEGQVPQAKKQTAPPDKRIAGIDRIIAVASGKGGVGKSTVTANLATALHAAGHRVGILDADIYGPSQPKMFGVEGYIPDARNVDGAEMMLPAVSHGIKIMSIGFFIKPSDALIWRGPMATNALGQLLRQTLWGELDFLLIDMPPGTGDIHLAIVQQLAMDGAVIVSTPQQVAVSDVRRGVSMFRTEGIDVPVLGIIENMSWFTPAELPQNRYYIFGRGGAKELARQENIDFLGEIPIIQSVMECSENGQPASALSGQAAQYYREIAEKIVGKM